MANSKTDEQEVTTPEEAVEPTVEPVMAESPVEPVSGNARSYFFPNDGQPFSCDAASLEEAEKKNTQYLQQRKESNS